MTARCLECGRLLCDHPVPPRGYEPEPVDDPQLPLPMTLERESGTRREEHARG